MISFKNYLIEAPVNTHLQHLEELIFLEGVDGTRRVINFLRDLRDMLAGHAEKPVNITVKWDGCLHEETKIITNKGIMTIKQIIESWHINSDLAVIGHDGEQDVWVPVLDCFATISKKNWISVQIDDQYNLILTEDHQVKTTNRGWVEAKNLVIGDDLEISETINKDGIHRFYGEQFNEKKSNNGESL